MANMSVLPKDGNLVFLVGAAPVASVLFNGRELNVKMDEEQATFFGMSFPMNEITTIEGFLEKLKGLRMAIEDRTKQIVTVDG